MSLFKKIASQSPRAVAFQLFAPVAFSGALYLLHFPLPAFIVFQFFIESFALWQLSIGLALFSVGAPMSRRWFIFNMAFAMAYRLGTNGYQVYHHLLHGEFIQMEKLLWLVPIHLYATGGVLYCFYVNSLLLQKAEQKVGKVALSVKENFLRLLLFPWGLWSLQPRLKKIILHR